MIELRHKISAEIENISTVISELKIIVKKKEKTKVELAGIAAYLHNYYTGIENIIKQILIHKQIKLPNSPTWHKDLLELASKNNILSKEIIIKLGKFLVFRHYFIHSYGFFLDEDELNPLLNSAPELFVEFKNEIKQFNT